VEKTTKEELQAYFEEKIKSAVDTIVSRRPTQPYASTESAENGLLITGLKALRKLLKTSNEEDPCDVIHSALKNVDAASYYTKIVPILSSVSHRRCNAESAIVYFTSGFHRRWISGQLRRMLAKQNAKLIGIRDVFEKNLLEESRNLMREGFHLKAARAIDRFRVVNNRNLPVLLVAKNGKRYEKIAKELLETVRQSFAEDGGNEGV